MNQNDKVIFTETFRRYGVLEARKGTKGVVVKIYQDYNSDNTKLIDVCDVVAIVLNKSVMIEKVPLKLVEIQNETDNSRTSLRNMTNEELIDNLTMYSAQQVQVSTKTKKFEEYGKKIEKIRGILLERLEKRS